MTEVTALTKDKLLHVLGLIGNHGMLIPISYIQELYDKYGDKYDFETSECKLMSENRYWRSGWRDKNGTFTNDYHKYKEEIENQIVLIPRDRTINIMMIAKRFPIIQMKSEIAKYMSEECDCPIERYTDDAIHNIVKTAFIDWLGCCDQPRMRALIHNYFDCISDYSDETERMLFALGFSQVAEKGSDGKYYNICGFHETDFTRKLDANLLGKEEKT